LQGKNAAATAVIVAAGADGPLTLADIAAIDRTERAAARVSGVTQVRDQGTSADGPARRALAHRCGPCRRRGRTPPAR
jgi:hypothetical protein